MKWGREARVLQAYLLGKVRNYSSCSFFWSWHQRMQEGKIHNTWHTIISECDHHWVFNKSGKQKHLETGFWQRTRRSVNNVKYAVISNYSYCWKHSEVWLVWFGVRGSFSESGKDKTTKVLETGVLRQAIRQILWNRDKNGFMLKLKGFKLKNSTPAMPK